MPGLEYCMCHSNFPIPDLRVDWDLLSRKTDCCLQLDSSVLFWLRWCIVASLAELKLIAVTLHQNSLYKSSDIVTNILDLVANILLKTPTIITIELLHQVALELHN
jgi:hypothetical protein